MSVKARAELRTLPVGSIRRNPDQPRKVFRKEALEELAESIRDSGLLQPIKVRPDGGGKFLIVCGERRWRAHKLLGEKTILAIVEAMTDEELADAAIIENLQRQDITPLEEAHAFQARLDQGVSPTDLAKRLGVAPHRVQFRVALLRLQPEYQDAVQKGHLDMWQAHYLARLSPGYQRLMFEAISKGKCQTRGKAQSLCEALLAAERRNGKDGAAPLKLSDPHLEGEQTGLFKDTGPTKKQRAALTALERKIEAVTDLVCAGFDENEVIVAGKVSRANAEVMAEKLRLLEGQLRKMRRALEEQAAAAYVAKAVA